MRSHIVIIALFVCYFSLFKVSGHVAVVTHECKVSIDLVSVTKEKDRVRITITPPPIKSRKIRYVLPAYLSGIGKKVDGGQFVHEFYALDDRGQPLKAVKKSGGNVILLKLHKGRTLRKLEYWVDDSWDGDDNKSYHRNGYDHVPNASGTSFDQLSGFLLNPALMVGYFDGYAWIPYRLTVAHNSNVFPFTSLGHTETGFNRDEFLVNSYNELIEHPIYYGQPDTCGFVSRNVYVDIAVYSESGNVTARQIRKYIGAHVSACTRFMGNVPEQHYKMLFYFVSPENYKARLKGVFGGTSQRNSAVYYLLESTDEDQIMNMVRRECSGDILKLLSLLNHSIELNGDFLKPQVTSCWWLAEGLKSYFTWLADLRDSVSNETDYMAVVSAKVGLYSPVKNMCLTDVHALEKAMQDSLLTEQYRAKAMLMFFILDIKLTKWSGGEKGLREIVLELNDSANYDCDSIAGYISRTVSTEVNEFNKRYCSGKIELPVIETLSSIGWAYSPTALDSMLTFGLVSLYYDVVADAFFVRQAEVGNRLKLQNGDRLVSIDGLHVDASYMDDALALIYSPQSVDAVEVIFIRGHQNERVIASPFYRTLIIHHLVRIDPAAGPDAELLHARIFSPFDY